MHAYHHAYDRPSRQAPQPPVIDARAHAVMRFVGRTTFVAIVFTLVAVAVVLSPAVMLAPPTLLVALVTALLVGVVHVAGRARVRPAHDGWGPTDELR